MCTLKMGQSLGQSDQLTYLKHECDAIVMHMIRCCLCVSFRVRGNYGAHCAGLGCLHRCKLEEDGIDINISVVCGQVSADGPKQREGGREGRESYD